MFQPTYSEDLNTGEMFLTVASGITVPSWQVTIVVNGEELEPDQQTDRTEDILNAESLAFKVEGKEYPIPPYNEIGDEQVQGILESMVYPE